MRNIKFIVIHCSATLPKMDVGAAEINQWHIRLGWRKIGYHFVIRQNGALEQGRKLNEIPAQARGYNQHAIAICYVGGLSEDGKPFDTRTEAQRETMKALVSALHEVFPNADILGHRDLPGVKKACPSFDVKSWLSKINI